MITDKKAFEYSLDSDKALVTTRRMKRNIELDRMLSTIPIYKRLTWNDKMGEWHHDYCRP